MDAGDFPEHERSRFVDAARLAERVSFTTGYVVRPSKSRRYAAFIEVNVHADMLWRIVSDLADALLRIVASPLIGTKHEMAASGPYTHRERALAVFEPFAEHLAHDGFLEWGVMFQYRGVTEEVFVKSAKYVQIWTNDPPRAGRVLHRHGIREVASLKFIDEYPLVSTPLPFDGHDAGCSVVLEQITAAFANLPRVQPP